MALMMYFLVPGIVDRTGVRKVLTISHAENEKIF